MLHDKLVSVGPHANSLQCLEVNLAHGMGIISAVSTYLYESVCFIYFNGMSTSRVILCIEV